MESTTRNQEYPSITPIGTEPVIEKLNSVSNKAKETMTQRSVPTTLTTKRTTAAVSRFYKKSKLDDLIESMATTKSKVIGLHEARDQRKKKIPRAWKPHVSKADCLAVSIPKPKVPEIQRRSIVLTPSALTNGTTVPAMMPSESEIDRKVEEMMSLIGDIGGFSEIGDLDIELEFTMPKLDESIFASVTSSKEIELKLFTKPPSTTPFVGKAIASAALLDTAPRKTVFLDALPLGGWAKKRRAMSKFSEQPEAKKQRC